MECEDSKQIPDHLTNIDVEVCNCKRFTKEEKQPCAEGMSESFTFSEEWAREKELRKTYRKVKRLRNPPNFRVYENTMRYPGLKYGDSKSISPVKLHSCNAKIASGFAERNAEREMKDFQLGKKIESQKLRRISKNIEMIISRFHREGKFQEITDLFSEIKL